MSKKTSKKVAAKKAEGPRTRREEVIAKKRARIESARETRASSAETVED